MKKHLLVSLLLSLLLLLPLTAQAYDDGTVCMAVQNGVHDWRSISYTDPTCTTDGSRIWKCRWCNRESTEVLPALGHNWVEERVEPTCTTDGYRRTYCSRCNEQGQVVPLYATGHTPVTLPGYEAWCTTDGLTEGSQCSTCGTVLTPQQAIPALGHNFQDDWYTEQEATCTAAGSQVRYCHRCQQQETRAIPALGHAPTSVPGKAATCTETGLTEGSKCSRCGATLTAQSTIPALGHAATSVPGKAATCTETGLTEGSKCSRCGATLTAQSTIPALGHVYELSATQPATPTADGYNKYTCTRCGDSYTEVIPKTACTHSWGAWREEYPATCVQQGMRAHKCTICGVEEYEYTGYGDHDWGEWTTVKEPTATEDGLEERVCKNTPNHVETREISIDPHPAAILEYIFAEDAGVGKRYEGAEVLMTRKVTNTGDCTLYFYGPFASSWFDVVTPRDDLHYIDMGDGSGNYYTLEPGEFYSYSGYYTVNAEQAETGVKGPTGSQDMAILRYYDGKNTALNNYNTLHVYCTFSIPLTYPEGGGPEAAEKYVLKGVTWHFDTVEVFEGVTYMDSTEYPKAIWDGAEPQYYGAYTSDLSDYDHDEYYIGWDGFVYADPDDLGLDNRVKKVWEPGETYYASILVRSNAKNDHSMDFTQVDPALVDVTVDGCIVKLMEIEPTVTHGQYDAVILRFSITVPDEGPHPAIDVKIWADPGAGDGKRYEGAKVSFHYEATNTGDCPVYVPWWPNNVDASAPNGRIEVAGMGWDIMGVALLNPGETYTDRTIYSVHASQAEKGYIKTSCWGDAWYYDTDGEIQQIWTDSNELTIDLTYPPDHEPEPAKPALNITWRFDRVYPNPGIDTGMYETTKDKLYEPHLWVLAEFDILNAGNVPLYVKVYFSLGNGLTSETKWPGGRDEYTFQPGESQLSGWGFCPLSDFLTPGTETAELLGTVDITMWAKGFDLKTGKELCESNPITRSWKVRKDGTGTPEPDPGKSKLTVSLEDGKYNSDPAGYQLGEKCFACIYVSNEGSVAVDDYTIHVDYVAANKLTCHSPDSEGPDWYEVYFDLGQPFHVGNTAMLGASSPRGYISEDDVARGYVQVSVYVTWTDPGTGTKRQSNTATITLPVISKTGLLLKKDVAFGPKNGSFYQEGEPIQWTLTVTNNSKEPIKNVVVTDQGLTVGAFDEIAPGDTRTCDVPAHTVTAYEADVVGYVSNVASATGENLQGISHTWHSNEMKVLTNAFSPIPVPYPGMDTGDGIPGGGIIIPGGGDGGIFDPGYPGGSVFDPLTPIIGANTGAAVVKADVQGPANGEWYEKDDTIEYTITVKNVGETTLTDLKLYDSLGGLIPIGTLDALAPGDEHTFPFNYTVPFETGYVLNIATLTYTVEGMSGTPVKSNPVYSQVGKDGYIPGGGIIGGTPGGGIPGGPGGGVIAGPEGGGSPYFPGLHPFDPTGDPTGDPAGSGKGDFCALTLDAMGESEIRYTLHACAEHAEAARQAESASPAEAIEIWREEISKLYETLYEAGCDEAKAAVLNDQIAFWAYCDAYRALYGDEALRDLLRLRCAELCCIIHTAQNTLPDSILGEYALLIGHLDGGEPGRAFGPLDGRDCAVTVRLNGALADALSQVRDTVFSASSYAADEALSRTFIHWQTVLDRTVNQAYKAADRGQRKVIAAWRQMLDRVYEGRRDLLMLLYPGNPATAQECLTNLYRDAAIDACGQK